ncbi:MAG: GNAT family N-acetyltransferase [Euryarchaeota archaeon]|nr:GNAT family N-acetyltransferase [Euryarchaeota archaeon]
MSELPGRLACWNIELEYGVASDGTLFALSGKSDDELPLLVVLRYDGGHLLFFHPKVPRLARLRLDELGEEAVLEHPENIVDVLRENRVAGPRVVASPFYEGLHFAVAPTPLEGPEVVEERDSFRVVRDGRAVTKAWTVRENAWAAEVAVETLPDFRRQGLARQVTAAWGHRVLASGRVAFFSHRRDDFASAALARSLGLSHYATTREYSNHATDRPDGQSAHLGGSRREVPFLGQ